MLTLSRVCTLLRVYTRVHVFVCIKFEVRMQVGGMLALKAERYRGATGGKPLERNRGARGRKPLTWRHEQQGDAAPASLLKKAVTKKDGNDDSEDDDFYDRTASRAKVPLCPLPLNFKGLASPCALGQTLQLARSLYQCGTRSNARLPVWRLLGGPRYNIEEDTVVRVEEDTGHSSQDGRGLWRHECCREAAHMLWSP